MNGEPTKMKIRSEVTETESGNLGPNLDREEHRPNDVSFRCFGGRINKLYIIYAFMLARVALQIAPNGRSRKTAKGRPACAAQTRQRIGFVWKRGGF